MTPAVSFILPQPRDLPPSFGDAASAAPRPVANGTLPAPRPGPPRIRPQWFAVPPATEAQNAAPPAMSFPQRLWDLGRDELGAMIVSAATVALAARWTADPLLVSAAGLVSEKIPFFVSGWIKARKANPEAPLCRMPWLSLKHAASNLTADMIVHDPLYTGLTYYGMASGSFAGWEGALSALSFGIGLVAAAAAQHAVERLGMLLRKSS